MKKSRSNSLISIASTALVIVVTVSLIVSVLGIDRIEPENVINSASDTSFSIEAVSARLNQSDDGKNNDDDDNVDPEDEDKENSEDKDEENNDEDDDENNEELDDNDSLIEQDDGNPEERDKTTQGNVPGVNGKTNNGNTHGGNNGGDDGDKSGDGKTGEEGDGGDDGETGEEGDGSEDGLRLVTDLSTRIVYVPELVNNKLPFYAYLFGGEDDMELVIKINNDTTSLNGKTIAQYKADNHVVSTAELALNRNVFYVYLRQGGKSEILATFTITYFAERATEENPQVGDNPPKIVIMRQNGDIINNGDVVEESNRYPTFVITAYKHDGTLLYDDYPTTRDRDKGVRVYHEELRLQNMGNIYEPGLNKPYEGEYQNNKFIVKAWDDEGNSLIYSFTVRFHDIDEGDYIGWATLSMDLTNIGLDIFIPEFKYHIRQKEPASYAVLQMLDEWGFQTKYGGTPDRGFYLQSIESGNFKRLAKIPDNLWAKILQDELSLTPTDGTHFDSILQEMDWTQGSGFMYAVGGVYPGKGLDRTFLSDGDHLVLRFTLAYGKDIGGYGSTGGGQGTLSSYCGTWINETYIDQHAYGDAVTIEATCTEAGRIECPCTRGGCGYIKTDLLGDALGHQYEETERVEPTATEDGYAIFTCSICNDIKTDVLAATGDNGGEVPPEIPDDQQPPIEITSLTATENPLRILSSLSFFSGSSLSDKTALTNLIDNADEGARRIYH